MSKSSQHAFPIKYKSESTAPTKPQDMSYEAFQNYVREVESKPLTFKNHFGQPYFKVRSQQPLPDESGKPTNRGWIFRSRNSANGMLGYIGDAHGNLQFNQIYSINPELKDFIWLPKDYGKTKIFDQQTGLFLEPNQYNVPEVHPLSPIFDIVVAFDPEFLKLFSVTEDFVISGISQIIFDNVMKFNKHDASIWQMQGALHRNTSAWHFHFRLYQAKQKISPITNTWIPVDDSEISTRFTLKKQAIPVIRESIGKFMLGHARILKDLFKGDVQSYIATVELNSETNLNFEFANLLLDLLKANEASTPEEHYQQTQQPILNLVSYFSTRDEEFMDFMDKLDEDISVMLTTSVPESQAEVEEKAFKEKTERIKFKIMSLILEYFALNFLHWISTVDGKTIPQWIENNKFANSSKFDKSLIDAFVESYNQFGDEPPEEFEIVGKKEEPEVKQRYHNPRNMADTLSFNKMASWNVKTRQLYKKGVAVLGSVFRNSFSPDLTYLKSLLEELQATTTLENLELELERQEEIVANYSFK